MALSRIDGRAFSHKKAAPSWYGTIYISILHLICRNHILGDFAGRTETDLVVWVASHQQELGKNYGYDVPLGDGPAAPGHRLCDNIQSEAADHQIRVGQVDLLYV
jgi:hypothetical protein